MTPNTGQGGAMAIEDAIVLTRHLHTALGFVEDKQEEKTLVGEKVKEALEGYQAERQARTSAMAEQSFGIGRVVQSEWAVVQCLRDWVVVPRGVRKETFMKHALFDVDKLPGEV